MKNVPRLNVPDDILEGLIKSKVAPYSDDVVRRNATAFMRRMEFQSPEAFAEMKAQAEVIAAEVETAVNDGLRDVAEGRTISLEDYIADGMAKRRQREAKKN